MKKAIVIPNSTKDTALSVTLAVIQRLTELGFVAYISKEYKISADTGATEYNELPTDADFIVVVGGDGSIIDASRHAILLDIPIFGINLGKVGYLSEVEPDNLRVLDRLVSGEYKIEQRMLLSAEKHSENGDKILSDRLAMNDVIISRESHFGVSELVVENGRGDYLKYHADGVICATPVGSTAYSLSAGGPIISHNLSAITVTPISAHSLFNRSIVYDSYEVLKISNTSPVLLNVRIDGRSFALLSKGEFCKITVSEKRLKMLTFSNNNMFATLFKKIKVLEDKV